MPFGLKLFRTVKVHKETELRIESLIPVEQIEIKKLSLSDGVLITRILKQNNLLICTTTPFSVDKNYILTYLNVDYTIQPGPFLDVFFSEKEMGCLFKNDRTVFRLFAPRALQVILEIYDQHDSTEAQQFQMKRDSDGVWETECSGVYASKYYGYRINGPEGVQEAFDDSMLIGDPYSRAVVTDNNYHHHAKTLILPQDMFDWEGDTWLKHEASDLIIYELHVRDMTVHPSSGVRNAWRGTYLGLTDATATGGLNHLKKLGVNAVELLPIQEFANYEVDYKNKNADVYNYWNPYARNHWGYMTSYFFAPESYYATGNSLAPHTVCGATGNAVTEMKQLVKILHQNNFSVIMDVVYNHVSQYDQNPFKLIDKKYYFRLDDDENYLSDSYCGNDFKTERPMTRKLIVDSLKYWMTEYHIDGFRFDLAGMIDETTLDDISRSLREINSNVILIAEPWGGRQFDWRRFSIRGWSAWNDQFRNGIKGQNAHDGLGYLFGHWYGQDNWSSLKRYMLGNTLKEGGFFEKSSHSVNYLESHDDLTLADFIRIGSREFNPEKPVTDMKSHVKLSPGQLRLSKLAALALMSSQGCVMIHAGQEYARSKVIAKTSAPEAKVGFINHDTYNKDDETNWINYEQIRLNQTLFEYYQGLIAIRCRYAILRAHDPQQIHCWGSFNTFGFAMHLVDHKDTDVLILLNSHGIESSGFELPKGQWTVLADEQKAGLNALKTGLSGHIEVPPVSGLILIKSHGSP